jgi:hypothetical protein
MDLVARCKGDNEAILLLQQNLTADGSRCLFTAHFLNFLGFQIDLSVLLEDILRLPTLSAVYFPGNERFPLSLAG